MKSSIAQIRMKERDLLYSGRERERGELNLKSRHRRRLELNY